MAGRLISLYPAGTRASRLKRLTTNPPLSTIRGYCDGQDGSGGAHGIDQERAPSTAEEFIRVAEEKSRQGLISQTAEKARDGAEEATVGSSKLEHVKEAYKESNERGDTDIHKSGSNQ